MRVAVVGLGSAGPAAAVLLAGAGHEVLLLEREPDPGPVGAGIWLQHLGQQVLDRLGLLDDLRAVSRPVGRVEGVTVGGRTVMEMAYADLPGSVPALGVHRGVLFDLLQRALLASEATLRTGVTVTGVRATPAGAVVETSEGDAGCFDLVIGADGTRSVLRDALGVTRRDRPYSYGALWAVVDDPDGLAGDVLHQCFDGTRRYFGVLPTGERQASIFWSVPAADTHRVSGRIEAWRAEAAPFAGRYAPLLDRVEVLLPATYRDVAVRTPYRTSAGAAVVLVGDAAHAMSPQLGAGTSLALADAWVLADAIARAASLPQALAEYHRRRAAHVRWYRLWTRALVPAFQSDLDALALPRDLLAGPVGRLGWVRRQAVATLVGDRTSPWSGVSL